MVCKICKKRLAVLLITRMEGEKTINEGYCLKCAREMNVPQISAMMETMGITEADIEAMDEQFSDMMGDSFEAGGANLMPPFINNMLNSIRNMENEDSTENEKKEPLIIKEERKTKQNRKDKTKDNEKDKTKFLGNFCVNLTERARQGKIDLIVGRDKEIYRVEQILSRRSKNNPCLIGEPGVGKTAIAEGIAQRIASGNIPFRLMNKEVYLLDLTSLIAGTQFRGQFESRIKGLINEIKNLGNIILFIDEVHTLVGTGDSEGSLSAANIMKPALSRGEIQVIGATTFNEYRKHIENDSALERRFQPVTVNEPSIEETVDVLKGIKQYYSDHHKVKVSDEILRMAAVLSERYITDRFLPDKAIDLLDEACACCSLANNELTEYENLNLTLKKYYDEEEELETSSEENDEKYRKIAELKVNIDKTKQRLRELEPIVHNISVTVSDVAKVIELWTGIPADKIKQNELKKIGNMDKSLKEKIIGQDEAISNVSAAIKRSRAQISKKRRPASFIFVGPTGVGKTELVKILASELFDTVDPLIRLDMSEFMEKHAVSRIIGSPPGYVGYDEAGQLTEKVRRKPYSVILFDEIEKAHHDVMNILLQILDEGKITDAHGRIVNFENTVIAMTSNAGSSDKTGIAGFNKTTGEVSKEKTMKALSDFLRPEFLSRIDEVIVFNSLSPEDLEKIAELMLNEIKEPLAEKNIEFSFDEKVIKKLTEESQGGKYGARDLRKTIRKKVEDKLAGLIVDNAEEQILSISISANEKDLVFTTVMAGNAIALTTV